MILNAIGGAGGGGIFTTVSEVTCTVQGRNGIGAFIVTPIPFSDVQVNDILYIQSSSSSGDANLIDGVCLIICSLESEQDDVLYCYGSASGIAIISATGGGTTHVATECLDASGAVVTLNWNDAADGSEEGGDAVLLLIINQSGQYYFNTNTQYRATLLRPDS